MKKSAHRIAALVLIFSIPAALRVAADDPLADGKRLYFAGDRLDPIPGTSAARRWRYSPAMKDGRPVRYRKVIDFTLRGR